MAKNPASFNFDNSDFFNGLDRTNKQTKRYLNTALRKAGIQLLTWIVQGSPSVKHAPPILTGFLRGSGNVFVDGKNILTGMSLQAVKISEKPVNIGSISKKNDFEIVILFSAPYAEKMETTEYNLGPISRQASASMKIGTGFLSAHIQGDGPQIAEFIAKQMKAQLGG